MSNDIRILFLVVRTVFKMGGQEKRLRGVEIYYGVVVDLVKNNSSELQAKLSQSLFKLKKTLGKL